MRTLICGLLFAASTFAQGTVQQSIDKLGNTDTWVLAFRWTAGNGGAVPVTQGNMKGCCQGYLLSQIEIVPGAVAPTAGYSVKITDSTGLDFLGGLASSLGATAAQGFAPAAGIPPVQGSMNLVLTGNAVTSATGAAYVFMTAPTQVNVFNQTQVSQLGNYAVNIAGYPYFADNTGTTDNTAIYAAAIAALPANGGTIMIPPGTYRGSIVLPAYPKTVTIIGAGELATILIPAVFNTPVFTGAPTTPNFVSGAHVIGHFAIMAHASGSTGAAIEWKTLQRSTWEHITFLSNTNGTGNFAIGILCDDGGGDGVHQCYGNTADFITDTVQSGPVTMVDVKGASAANHFNHFNVSLNNTGMTTIFNFENSGENTNSVENSLFEGNGIATALFPGAKNRFASNYFEANLANITGNGGSENIFDGNALGGANPRVTCPNAESGWDFRGENSTSLVHFLVSGGCVNFSAKAGGAGWNQSFGSFIGGITTSQISAPGMTPFVIANQGTGLTAGTYHYEFTSANSAGESAPSSAAVTITSGQSPAQVGFVPSSNPNGAARFNVYGRSCAGTCGFLFSLDAISSNDVGLTPFDDGSISPGVQTPPTRNQTADINAAGIITAAQGGSASSVVCWKSDGISLGHATVAEITAGTCH